MNNIPTFAKVHIIAGHNKGKSGVYLGHYLHSGYSVPHIFMGEICGWGADLTTIVNNIDQYMYDIARPWDYEIVHLPSLEKEIEEHLEEIAELEMFILDKKKLIKQYKNK